MKFSVFLLLSFLSSVAFAQTAPQGINYQAVAHDATGQPLSSENVDVRFGILVGNPSGTLVWEEDHSASTDQYGLFNLIIGNGTSTNAGTVAVFSDIQWGGSPYFLNVQVDAGSGWENLGTMQFMSVPYALYAETSGSGGTTVTGGPGIDVTGGVVTNTGDTDPTDDITNTTSAGGDLTGTYPGPTIDKIQGVPINLGGATTGQAVVFDGSAWVPQSPTGFSAGTGIAIAGNTITNTGDTDPSNDITNTTTATGDVNGTFPNLSVIGIQGVPVSGNVPTNGQVLSYNGSDWLPLNPSGYTAGSGISIVSNIITNLGDLNGGDDITTATNGAGDVSGTFPSLTVDGLQNVPVSANAPTNGEILTYNGSVWLPQAPVAYTGGTGISITGTSVTNTGDTDPSDDITNTTIAGGDLSGTYPSPSVARIQTIPVSTNTPLTNQVLIYNGSMWIPATPTLMDALSDADGDTRIDVEQNTDEDVIRFTTAGTERMSIGATGAVVASGTVTSNTNFVAGGTGGYTYASPKTKKLSLPNAAFISVSQNYQIGHLGVIKYTYISGGTAGNVGWIAAPLQLPDGALLTQVDAWVYDNDASADIGVSVSREPNNGGIGSGTTRVWSTGASAVNQQLTSNPNWIIDIDNNFYHINFETEQNNSNLRVYHVLVTYTIVEE